MEKIIERYKSDQKICYATSIAGSLQESAVVMPKREKLTVGYKENMLLELRNLYNIKALTYLLKCVWHYVRI